jgi:hypothetical protein
MNLKYFKPVYTIVFLSLLTAGCDSLTEREENVTINLDSFNLVGSSSGALQARAIVTGNPGCTASNVSLNGLLATTENFDEIDEFLESLDIRSVRYRISNNTTGSDITASFQMTDPATNQLTNVAAVSIPADTNVNEWATLPFLEGGASVAEHYMDNRDSQFLYCVQGSPNSSDISLTMELQLDVNVTVDLF